MAKKKRWHPEEPTKCFAMGATVGHMLALSGEAHDAVRDGRRVGAYQAFDILEYEAREFQKLMGRRLDPEGREVVRRIQKTAKAVMKEIKPFEQLELKPIERKKRNSLSEKAMEMIHDVRALVKEGNVECGNLPDAELRSKPWPRGK